MPIPGNYPQPPMTISAEPRASEGKVILVDQAGLADAFSKAGHADRVVQVKTYFSAMGEAGRHPTAAVIGPAAALAGMAGSTAQALRHLIPQGKLLLTDAEAAPQEARQALEAGFDEAVDASRPEQIASVLGLSLTIEPASESSDFDSANKPSSEELSELEALAAGTPATLGALQEARQHAAASPPADLGDTDLVEAVLRGQSELAGLALRLAADRSGIAGLALSPRGKVVPEDEVALPVRYQGFELAKLHAPAPATTQQLQPWSDWLGVWLNLDQQFTELRDLSHRDELTGVWNRRYFNRFLAHILDRAGEDRQQVTLMIFDIDNFKHYNDTYGHPAGDEILREIARLMKSNCRDHDVVARIGGDEFAVIFWDAGGPRRPNSKHPQDVLLAAKRFQRAVCDHRFPKLLNEAAGTLTISAGLAGFPWDGRTPEELVQFADQMALRSKQQGKNAITFGPSAYFEEEDREE
jgi:diguanylate cyclase (GGDEF)-like protein